MAVRGALGLPLGGAIVLWLEVMLAMLVEEQGMDFIFSLSVLMIDGCGCRQTRRVCDSAIPCSAPWSTPVGLALGWWLEGARTRRVGERKKRED
jgi:hypothetical protein